MNTEQPTTDPQRQFTCGMGHGTFDAEWTEEEAMAESRLHFGEQPKEELAVVCDDCWMKIYPDRN